MASGKIRGITIELGGDASGLIKSMKDASKEVKSVQTALKDVEKLLKLNPTSTELLTQKQKLLHDQVDAVEKQLEEEKAALEALEKAGDSDKTEKQQAALKRQITETEAKLKDAKNELNSFGSVGAQQVAAVGDKFKALGTKVTEVGTKLTQNVTAPITALGVASVAAFNSVDAGYDTIIQKTGATGDELEEMNGIFDSIAATVPADWTEIGAAVGEVNTRFGLTGTELESLSTQFLQFAQLNNTDVSTAVDGTQKALAAFGLDASSAGTYLDTMNLVAQRTGVSVQTLQTGVTNNAAAFQSLGLSLTESTALIGQFELSGVNADTAMSGLSRALKTATEDGVPLQEALAALQTSIESGTGSTDGLTAAYDLFGKSGAQIYAAVQNGTLDFNNLSTAVTEAGGNVQTTFEATQDPTDKFKTAMQTLQLTGADLGATLLGVLTPAIEKVTEVVQKLKDWWNNLDPAMQDNIVKIGLVVAAIGPLLVVIGKVIGVIGTIMGLAPKLASAIGFLTSPVGLVVAAIAAAIAIGVLLWKNWDTVKAKAKEIWTKIKDFLINLWNGIKEKATAIWNGIKDFIVNLWNGIKEKASNIWNGIKTAVMTPIETLKTTLSGAWESIKSKASSVWEGVKSAITNPIETAKNTVKNIIDKIKGFFKFDWSLPKLKMPHISITGEFSLIPPSVPHFSIDWYKKAADAGAIFDSRTIFGGAGGQFFGAGDAAQPELLIGTKSLQGMITAAAQPVDPELIYKAVKEGAEAASLRAYISTAEVTQAAERGISANQFAGMRYRGAF